MMAKGYKGDDTGFARLYAAIWEKAVEDEYKKAKQMIYGYVLYEVNRINGRKIKKPYIQKAIDIISPELLKTVRENIYKESQQWPDNPKRGHTYPEYKAAALGIVTELIKGDADGLQDRTDFKTIPVYIKRYTKDSGGTE